LGKETLRGKKLKYQKEDEKGGKRNKKKSLTPVVS